MTLKTYFKIYGLIGIIKLAVNYIRTKIFHKEILLVRFPIEVRGKRQIEWGTRLTTGVRCRIEAFPYRHSSKLIKFGTRVEIGDFVHIAALENVIIGNHVLIGSKVYISDIQHGSYIGNKGDSNPEEIPRNRKLSCKPVEIQDNVWIGESVSVMPGVTIGKSSIIGANSVVTKSIPAYSIAVGNPAKVIKQYDFVIGKWVKI
ncbi:putative acetyltransferase [termite gut metagenome]|uniref:Putative acetyltransferase n=1 Tax=termite gut metagenome TaxID=433724 RepID=A0A5J4R358_9ZZZZ